MKVETATPREAAKLSGIGEHSIRDAVASGELASFPVREGSTHRRIRLADLEVWIEAKLETAAAARREVR